LYIEGPSQNTVAQERKTGLEETISAKIHVIVLRGQWTEDSAPRAVRTWLNLSTSKKTIIDLVVSQNDAMAIGARKAFQDLSNELEKERWQNVPFLDCDGVPKTGQSRVRSGLLTATIFTPPNAGQAMEMLVEALEGKKELPPRAFTVASSIPPIENLRPVTNGEPRGTSRTVSKASTLRCLLEKAGVKPGVRLWHPLAVASQAPVHVLV
jgi:ABC-type sugar transport system substrate-binding protein